MNKFENAATAPRKLLYQATFKQDERKRIEASPNLRSAITKAEPSEWLSILERDRAARRAAASAGPQRPLDSAGMRAQALDELAKATSSYAALTDGRREELFKTACRLVQYVVNNVLTEAEFRDALREAAEANDAIAEHGDAWFEDTITRALNLGKKDPLPHLKRRFQTKRGKEKALRNGAPQRALNGSGDSDEPGSTGSAGSQGSTDANGLGAKEKTKDAEADGPGFRGGDAGSAESDWLPKGFCQATDGSIEYEDFKSGEWLWLCSALAIVAATRTAQGQEWGRLILVRDRDGTWHVWAMPMAELAGSGEGYRAKLLSMGLELAPGAKAREALHRLLTSANPRARARCVSTLGWHGPVYLLPDETFGETHGEQLVLQTGNLLQHNFHVAGTLDGWQQTIAKLAVGNSRVAFAIAMAFAAPLLRPLGFEGGGVHCRGSSSIGKTTLGEVAGSVCGGGPDGYKLTWRATDNALEAVAAAHNDGFAVLDEISQISGEALGQVAYMLPNGQAKRRMNRDASARSVPTWRLLFLSTGEIGLADKVREGKRGGRLMAGQQVRVLDIAVDAGAGHGVFDTLHGFENGQALADHLKSATAQHHGHALREFLRRLVRDPWQDDVQNSIKTFVGKMVPRGADGQVARAAYRFAVIAAAGELAQSWGILPWPKGEATRAAQRLFGEWLTARGGADPAEIEAGFAAVRLFLEQHGSSRFAPWHEPNRVVHNRAGFWRAEEDDAADFEATGRKAFYVLPETWGREILAGHDPSLIAREMARRGMLKVNADGKPNTKQRLPDRTERRVYVVLPTLFEGPEA